MVASVMQTVLTHVGLWPIRLIGRLGWARARRLTGRLAPLLKALMPRRRRIVDQNLAWCFPEHSTAERLELRDAHFRHLAEAIGEMAVAWSADRPAEPELGEVQGLEHIQDLQAKGQGVLLVTGHTVCIESAARLLGESITASGTYRPLNNPVLEHFQNQGRARYAEGMFSRDDLRGMVRYLRGGGALWYAPDQDFGPALSEFVPFFGIPTATVRALPDLARLGRAKVVGVYPIKDPDTGRVVVHVEPAWDDFPSADVSQDLGRFNAFLERHIRQAPSQYWWLHRRFKSHPDGSRRY
ncbi:MAG: lysophospholipid acyltransferase family protein [Wenzhouxiangella sp.]|jgi:KDO2-lipid IV(A) lauroyltransferase|nr:lysophospholipid acyltransferase family protein [Wenzhouxiangella sp.]